MQTAIGHSFHLIGIREANIDIDIPEPHDTLQANASEKSKTINRLTGQNCFSEDTGLEVPILNGEPGVRSARYAGDKAGSVDNVNKLLHALSAETRREAQFRTVISLILDGEEHFFEGICKGRISEDPIGQNGFGYDPVFIPDGSSKTFAEMDGEEKNQYSHRKKAADQLVRFLQTLH